MSKSAQKCVLAVGDVDIDIVFTGLTNLPRAEQDTLADSLETTVGGQTGTIARALARLGLAVTFVGRVGDDDYGRRCRDELARAGVSVDDLMVDSAAAHGRHRRAVHRSRARLCHLPGRDECRPAHRRDCGAAVGCRSSPRRLLFLADNAAARLCLTCSRRPGGMA